LTVAGRGAAALAILGSLPVSTPALCAESPERSAIGRRGFEVDSEGLVLPL